MYLCSKWAISIVSVQHMQHDVLLWFFRVDIDSYFILNVLKIGLDPRVLHLTNSLVIWLFYDKYLADCSSF